MTPPPPPPPPPPLPPPPSCPDAGVSLKFQAKKSEISFSYFLPTASVVKTIQTPKSDLPRRQLGS